MRTVTPLDRVIQILVTAKYCRVSTPLIVASVPFHFAAVLIGADRAPDLIVIVDTVEDPELRIRQKIDSLGRALDVAGSRRPLTAILVGPKPSDSTLDLLSRVCRVLPVGTPVGDEAETALRDWLAVLLPLPLPDPSKVLANPMGELQSHLPKGLNETLQSGVLAAASRGRAAVQMALKECLATALADVESLTGEGE
jgi:hypothetical protein